MDIDNNIEKILRTYMKKCKIKLNSKYIAPIIKKEKYNSSDIKNILEELMDEMYDIRTIIAEIGGNVDIEKIKNIYLPPTMSIGIELESEGEYGKIIYRMSDIIEERWECKRRVNNFK